MAEEVRAIGWDEEITVEKEPEFVLLEPGEYNFTVTSFERGHYDGSSKLPACSVAKLALKCSNGIQETTVFVNLFLVSNQKWKLTHFFKSCRLIAADMPEGVNYAMPWSRVIGAQGRALIKNREYNNKQYNEVEKFLYDNPETTATTATVPAYVTAPSAPAPAQAPAPATGTSKYGAL